VVEWSSGRKPKGAIHDALPQAGAVRWLNREESRSE
jgi:hypothetical protein